MRAYCLKRKRLYRSRSGFDLPSSHARARDRHDPPPPVDDLSPSQTRVSVRVGSVYDSALAWSRVSRKGTAVADNSAQARIEELAESKLGKAGRVIVRREIRKLSGKLGDREEVVNLARGKYDGKQGLLIVTDRRVLFVEEGVVRSRIEDFPYERVSSVQTERGVVHGKVIIFASGNKAEIDNIMPKDRAVEIGDYTRAKISRSLDADRPQTPPPAPPSDPAERLAKLARLRDSGVISEEEFESQKSRILSEI
jgi:hypothetical protein